MSTLDVRQWNVRHLVGASAAYWTALAATTLAPFARAVASLARVSGQHGSVTAGFSGGAVNLTVIQDGVATYTASAPLLPMALWIAGPPLVLWLVWLALRPSRDGATELPSAQSFDALPDAARGGLGDPNAAAPHAAHIERDEYGR